MGCSMKIKFGVHAYDYQDFLDAYEKKIKENKQDMKTHENANIQNNDDKKP